MNFYRYIYAIIYFISNLILNGHLYAQFSEYHSVINPYDFVNNTIYNIGCVTYALPDYSINIQNNPVAPTFIDRSRIYFGVSQNISKYDLKRNVINFLDIDKKNEQFTQNKIQPNIFSGSFPFKLGNKIFKFSLSVNKIHSPEYELWLGNNKYPELEFHHQREGNVWNTSIGFSHCFPLGIDIGVSWSKWFGNWHWSDSNSLGTVSGEGEYKYNGNTLNFGILKRISKLSICFILHSPVTLMKADNINLKWGEDLEYYNLYQHFSGSFKVGIAYHFKEKLSLSAGYRYQGGSYMKINYRRGTLMRELKEDYGPSHMLSIGGEYYFITPKKRFPIFLVYSINWMPSTPQVIPENITSEMDVHNINSYGYQFLTINKELAYISSIALGINYPFKLFVFHLAGQWGLSSINIFNRTTSVRLHSSWRPPECIEVERTSFMLNLGVSFAFKTNG